jgi:recombinational DNA repair protein RecT
MSKTLSIIERPETTEKFTAIYKAVHKCNIEDAKNFFEIEKFAFRAALESTPVLKECSELSVASTFLEVISNGLSFEKSAQHVYLIPRNVKVGDQWEKRMTYSYASQGIIYLCKAAGSIQDCTPPQIVFEGDDIEVKTVDGRLVVNHSKAIPRKSKKILGGYCYVNTNVDREAFWMDIEEVERLIQYSAKANKGNPNELYKSGPDGQIDTGFFGTKIIKAALKNYRRKKTVNDNEIEEDVLTIESEPNEQLDF